MSYTEQVRDPSLALNASQQKQENQNSGVNWWKWIIFFLVVKVAVVILLAKYRPDVLRQWLARIGLNFGGSGLGGINPNGWV